MDIEKLRASLAKADDEKRYSIHRQYKKILCDIVDIDANGAIPDSLTYKQIARFFCPSCQEKQKVIADYISCTVNNFYPEKPIYSDYFSVNDINELAKELNVVIPDYVLWWINGHKPKNIILPDSHPPSGIEQSNKVINDHSRYKARDNDFKAWISEAKPSIANMKKADIHKELIKRNSRLWASGFSSWWEKRANKEETSVNNGRRKTNKPT